MGTKVELSPATLEFCRMRVRDGMENDEIYESLRLRGDPTVDEMTFREFSVRYMLRARGPYPCQYCGHEVDLPGPRGIHEKACPQNPDVEVEVDETDDDLVVGDTPTLADRAAEGRAGMEKIRAWEDSADRMLDTIDAVLDVLEAYGHTADSTD